MKKHSKSVIIKFIVLVSLTILTLFTYIAMQHTMQAKRIAKAEKYFEQYKAQVIALVLSYTNTIAVDELNSEAYMKKLESATSEEQIASIQLGLNVYCLSSEQILRMSKEMQCKTEMLFEAANAEFQSQSSFPAKEFRGIYWGCVKDYLLGKIDISFLIENIDHENSEIRCEFAHTLRLKTKQDFGKDKSKWREWQKNTTEASGKLAN